MGDQPYVTIRSRRPGDGNGSPGAGAGDIQARSATHDISRTRFHLKNLSQFSDRLQESAARAFPNRGRTSQRYKNVQALLLHWGTDDLFVLPELEDLEKCLREDYAFDTDIFAIPSENSHLELMMRVGQLIKEHESNDTLFLIYYGGHARIDESRQSTWCATRDAGSVWLQWSAIQTLLERSKSDVLILLDCCAGAASATFPNGNSITETISASSWDAIAPDPGRYSFTNALIEVLQEWRLRNFSAAMLHAEVLARLKHPRPITINGKLFEARSTPVHFMMTTNHKAPSIEFSRLVPVDHLPPSPQEEPNLEIGGALAGMGRAPGAIEPAPSASRMAAEPNEDTPHVMLSLALEENQELDINAWEQWLSAFPGMAKYVKIQGVFKSHSTMLLVSMPVMIWDLLPEDHATSFVAFIRSNNLAMRKTSPPPMAVSVPADTQSYPVAAPDNRSLFTTVTGTTAVATDAGSMGRFGSVAYPATQARDIGGSTSRPAESVWPSHSPTKTPTSYASTPSAAGPSRTIVPTQSFSSLSKLQRQPTSSSLESDHTFSRHYVVNQHQSQRRTNLGDDVPEPKKFSAHVERRLDEYYRTAPYPSDADRQIFASNLGIEPYHLEVWFHHRRQRDDMADRLAAIKQDDMQLKAGTGPRMILPGDLDQLLEISNPGQIVFIDLRSDSEFERSHIHGAVNLRAPQSFMQRTPLQMIEGALTNDVSRRAFSQWRNARCMVFYSRGLEASWECPSADIMYERLLAHGWIGRCFILKGHYREFSDSYEKYIDGPRMSQEAKNWVDSQRERTALSSDSGTNQELYARWLSHVEIEDRARPIAMSPERATERGKLMEQQERDLEAEFTARCGDLFRRALALQPSKGKDTNDNFSSKARMVEHLDRGLAKIRDAQDVSPPAPMYDPEYSKPGRDEYFSSQHHDPDMGDEYVEVRRMDAAGSQRSHPSARSSGEGPTAEEIMRRGGRGGNIFNKVFRR